MQKKRILVFAFVCLFVCFEVVFLYNFGACPGTVQEAPETVAEEPEDRDDCQEMLSPGQGVTVVFKSTLQLWLLAPDLHKSKLTRPVSTLAGTK